MAWTTFHGNHSSPSWRDAYYFGLWKQSLKMSNEERSQIFWTQVLLFEASKKLTLKMKKWDFREKNSFPALTHQQSLWNSCSTSFCNFFFLPSVFRASINFKPTSLGQIWSEIFIAKFQFENVIQKLNENQNSHAFQDQGRGRLYTRMRQFLVYPSSHYIPTSLNKYFLLRNWPPLVSTLNK